MEARHLWLEVIAVIVMITGASCLQGVRMEIVPEVVQRGQGVILRCYYDLENAPLYSLKWYRGKHEFYRYSPGDDPQIKVFNVKLIHVDRAKSNTSQVTLYDVDFYLAGTFSCEVTADAPTFSTLADSKNLTVVSLPSGRPVIAAERNRYVAGDTLRANCSLPSSKPPAHLTFMLNNMPVEPTARNQETKDDEGTQWSEIGLTLQPFHYVNGYLNLRCIAQIPGIYLANSELQLGSSMREPVPERVTSEGNSGSGTLRMTFVTILCLGTLHLLLR